MDANKSHWEWMVPVSAERLHYVPDDAVRAAYHESGEDQPGVAICGLHARWSIPGVFSRMGLPRCAFCCTRLGIPRGDGTPVNEAWAKRKAES